MYGRNRYGTTRYGATGDESVTTAKTLAVTTTVSGVLTRDVARGVLAAVNTVGALVRSVTRTVAGTVTSGASLVRSVGRTVLGVVNVAGWLLRGVSRSLAATVTAVGVAIRGVVSRYISAGVVVGNTPSIDVGPGAINRVNIAGAGVTWIAEGNPANASGTITSVEVWFNGGGTGVKVGTFYGSGASWTCRAYATLGAVSSGNKQTFGGLSIAVQAGDLIGLYFDTGFLEKDDAVGDGILWYSGDGMTGGAKTYTVEAGKAISVYATGGGAGGIPLIRSVDRTVAASVSILSGMARLVYRVIAAGVSVVGTMERIWDIGSTKALTATVTVAGTIGRNMDRIAAAAVSVHGSLIRSVSRSITGAVTVSGSVLRGLAKIVTASVTVVGAVQRVVSRTLRAITEVLGSLSTGAGGVFYKTLTATVTVAGAFVTLLQDIAYVMNRTIRKIFAKVQITYSDPYFSAGVAATADATGRYTYPAQTTDNVSEEAYKWFSLHRNILDDTFHPLPGNKTHSVGWWGTQLSAVVTGAFVPTYPKLTLTFASRPVISLLVVGDDQLVEYPVDFTVKLYTVGPVLAHTTTVTGNALVSWTQALSPIHSGIIQMELEITKWSRPNAVCKIAQFFTTVEELYESEEGDLVSVNLTEAREYTGSTIPQGNLSSSELVVRLENIDDKFSPGNTDSPLYGMLLNNRAIQAWLGVDLYPSGVRRWYPLGTFYSRDWSAPQNEIWAEVRALDALDRLRTTEFSTSQVYVGASLKTLAETVMTDAGLTSADWDIDAALAAITVPYAWFDRMTHREALRKIAAAALGQCYCNRDGKIVLEVYSAPGATSFVYDRSNFFTADNPLAWSEMINYVEAQATPRIPAVEQVICTDTEVITVPAGSTVTKTHFFTVSPCVDVLAPVIVGGADIHMDSHVDYAWGCLVTYHNTGGGPETVTSVTISGKPLEVIGGRIAVAQDAGSIAQNGKQSLTEVLSSEFWQSETTAQAVADAILATYKDPRHDVILRARGNIAQLLGDRIQAPTFAGDPYVAGDYAILSQDINWDGGLEVAITAQRIGLAPNVYSKDVTAEVLVAASVPVRDVVLIFFKTLLANVGVHGGPITRAISRTVQAFVSAVAVVGRATPTPIDIGSGASDRGLSYPDSYTLIDNGNTANATGTITSVELWFYKWGDDPTGVKVATFWKTGGATFTPRAVATIGSVTKGSKQTFAVNLAVEAGDYIGLYYATGAISRGFGSGMWFQNGDQTGGAASYSNSSEYGISIYGTGST